ncbi:hypothetical protein HY439_02920 [Candidatus Microgenomates bacterium]|nr:hypothetical protein [Candidatus Microgenomates bacterium]
MKFKLLLLIPAVIVSVVFWPTIVLADDCDTSKVSSMDLDQINDLLAKCERARQMSIDATRPLEGSLSKLEIQLKNIQGRVGQIEADLINKEKKIKEGEANLVGQEEILGKRARRFYIRSHYNFPLLMLFAQNTAADLTHELAYQKTLTDQDKQLIIKTALEIKDLEDKKKNLESEKITLAKVKEETDKQAAFFRKEIEGAKDYQSQLSQDIVGITQRQQEILSARSGQFIASIGDSELADDYNASIKGFREAAPSGSFAVFSFGAYTHRKGMSQYGARGRAMNGQDYKAILKAYYGKEPVSKDTGGDIKVSGMGSMNFEEKYLYGIAEMPSTWHPEALKVQAVAARTYAYRYKQEGKEICTSEACQVFSKSKSDNPPQAWKDAVNATRGQVIEDVITYYASTHGGYTTTMGWDTTDGGGGSNFVDKSYDKVGGSPWIYKAWYTQGYSVNSDKCGRSNPWLNGVEMADIVNAALVLVKGSGDEISRITPVSSCWGGDPYSMDELRSVAGKYGGISSASSVGVVQGTGNTNQVTINGVVLSGADFKKAFNLRAPGRMSIPQSGFAFFNIEKK